MLESLFNKVAGLKACTSTIRTVVNMSLNKSTRGKYGRTFSNWKVKG